MNSNFGRSIWLVAFWVVLPSSSQGAGFAAGISPSKFELTADPGDVLRDTVTIVNPTGTVTDFQFRTADWRLTETGGVEYFEDTLLDGSCRPWVRLERRAVRIDAGSQKNYRFEIHVPDDAAPGLCRFAILVEPAEAYSATIADGAITMPVVGRYAVITYVTIGDATADIEYLGISTRDNNGRRLPAVTLRNEGQTFDRVFGQVTAINSEGGRVSLVPSNFPILPGRSEQILLMPESNTSTPNTAPLQYPLLLNGAIEIGREVIRIDQVLE